MQQTTHTIGLLGGISWGATAEYYRLINLGVNRRLGGQHSAQMLIRSFDLHPLLERAEDIASIEAEFADAGRALCQAGASILGVASLTGHRYCAALKRLPVKFVDIVDAVGNGIRAAGYTRVAVWATSFALHDAALLRRFTDACGVRLVLPPEELRPALDRIVFTELANQVVSPGSLAFLQDLVSQQQAAGGQALLLASTDFSPVKSLLRPALPTLDATQMHCEALVEAACQLSSPPTADPHRTR